MIEQPLIEALHILYSPLEAADLQWAITGSLGLALHGMNLEIHDIDIQTNKNGAYAFGKLFSEYTITPTYYRASDRIRSHFGVFGINDVQVEVMGDLQKLLPDQTWEMPIRVRENSDLVTFDGMQLPVISLAHEYQAYKTLGRHEKAKKIKEWMEAHSGVGPSRAHQRK